MTPLRRNKTLSLILLLATVSSGAWGETSVEQKKPSLHYVVTAHSTQKKKTPRTLLLEKLQADHDERWVEFENQGILTLGALGISGILAHKISKWGNLPSAGKKVPMAKGALLVVGLAGLATGLKSVNALADSMSISDRMKEIPLTYGTLSPERERIQKELGLLPPVAAQQGNK